jgi:hypothetical protein
MTRPLFDGETYVEERDRERLSRQLRLVLDLMSDQAWRTLDQISSAIGGEPPASVSARLRDLRKERFGAHTVDRWYIRRGLFAYRVIRKDRNDPS